MNENIEIRCIHCGEVITDDDYSLINGEPICEACVDDYCRICDECGTLMYDDDVWGDENHCLCHSCYDRYYTRCEDCDAVIPSDDAYNYEGITLCCDCYNDRSRCIHEYPLRFSMVTARVSSVWSLKLTRAVMRAIMLKKSSTSPTDVIPTSISNLTAVWMRDSRSYRTR